MKKMTKCLNEWNPTIESLGQGKQIILIRNYGTTLKEFLLYPTTSYTTKNNFINSFQPKHQDFVKKNIIPKKIAEKNEVKYFAKVERVIEKPVSKIDSLKNYYIWTSEHVKNYLKSSNPCIWILRVYKLKKPIITERTRGIKYANLLEPVSLKDIKPVFSDNEFLKIVQEIENI